MYHLISCAFEWDEKKNQSNFKKHGIWFEEAKQAFRDPLALRMPDHFHSHLEDRFAMIGMSDSSRRLVIIFTEREDGRILRIISARKATATERNKYEKGI